MQSSACADRRKGFIPNPPRGGYEGGIYIYIYIYISKIYYISNIYIYIIYIYIYIIYMYIYIDIYILDSGTGLERFVC